MRESRCVVGWSLARALEWLSLIIFLYTRREKRTPSRSSRLVRQATSANVFKCVLILYRRRYESSAAGPPSLTRSTSASCSPTSFAINFLLVSCKCPAINTSSNT